MTRLQQLRRDQGIELDIRETARTQVQDKFDEYTMG